MAGIDIRALIGKLNPFSKKMLEAAAGMCIGRGNYEITIEHFLFECLDDPGADISKILKHYDIEISRFKRQIQLSIDSQKSGNSGKPVFSRLLMELLEDAWLVSSLELSQTNLRTGTIFLAMLGRSNRFLLDDCYRDLHAISTDDLKSNFLDITSGSIEEQQTTTDSEFSPQAGAQATGEQTALQQFAINFTEQARQGKIDPVFGREREIRQMVDILARRRKNNPIVVGEPGVGKTAVVEGLALKIVEGDVPDLLAGMELYGLDLGLLQAGASVKGQFEQRLKAVISEVKSSPKPIILFIDEAHTLIGAGGAAGGSDAANLLKPALARGELRTVAATTWSEYKKYFEKDPALARRFQLVKVEEPDVENAVLIMRGLRDHYEKAHNVYIRDAAVVATAELSERYISGRQLPDKAVDLLDTACARVKISMSSKPPMLDEMEKKKASLQRELVAIQRDLEDSIVAELSDREVELKDKLALLDDDMNILAERWQAEKAAIDRVLEVRSNLAELKGKPAEEGTEDQLRELKQALSAAEHELTEIQGKEPLANYEVTPEVVGKVVSDWTGIPVGDMVKDEAAAILSLGEKMRSRIKGQDHAIKVIEERVKATKAGLGNPNTPLGVFLLVGPSGVGKTETGLALADLLFGGERFVVTINMSEFQEKHTLSRLVGSPPGYVGYGEGGVLTEAVRQRPYSVVLLDEVEKADLEVMNLFYQVFDKGMLSDGEGRVIDFKNTIVLLTSNLATDVITEMTTGEDSATDEEISEAIRPILSDHFKPALLARMEIIPYFTIPRDAMAGIVRIKMNKLAKRMAASQRLVLEYGDDVVQQIVDRCVEVETGARNIDHIINKNLLPQIANEILQTLASEEAYNKLCLSVSSSGEFNYSFA
ncbi:MAG: type VI secretion system ATPase TssH [Gammaproteobacteria bacterium]|nr:type VI secretion system ATPase TssH [Gammaproteobacteria bacterium]